MNLPGQFPHERRRRSGKSAKFGFSEDLLPKVQAFHLKEIQQSKPSAVLLPAFATRITARLASQRNRNTGARGLTLTNRRSSWRGLWCVFNEEIQWKKALCRQRWCEPRLLAGFHSRGTS